MAKMKLLWIDKHSFYICVGSSKCKCHEFYKMIIIIKTALKSCFQSLIFENVLEQVISCLCFARRSKLSISAPIHVNGSCSAGTEAQEIRDLQSSLSTNCN